MSRHKLSPYVLDYLEACDRHDHFWELWEQVMATGIKYLRDFHDGE
jgi:hypothetical protein